MLHPFWSLPAPRPKRRRSCPTLSFGEGAVQASCGLRFSFNWSEGAVAGWRGYVPTSAKGRSLACRSRFSFSWIFFLPFFPCYPATYVTIGATEDLCRAGTPARRHQIAPRLLGGPGVPRDHRDWHDSAPSCRGGSSPGEPRATVPRNTVTAGPGAVSVTRTHKLRTSP